MYGHHRPRRTRMRGAPSNTRLTCKPRPKNMKKRFVGNESCGARIAEEALNPRYVVYRLYCTYFLVNCDEPRHEPIRRSLTFLDPIYKGIYSRITDSMWTALSTNR
jgi:hypothetical protein